MNQAKWKYVVFCCHPKFDTGSWTIAGTLATLPIFGTLFFLVFAISVPRCLCPDMWAHLNILEPGYKAAYVGALIATLSLVVFNTLCLYGAFKAQPGKMLPFMVVLIIFEIGIFGGSIFVFMQLAYLDQYVLLENESYWHLAKQLSEFKFRTELAGGLLQPLFPVPPDAFSEEFVAKLEGIWELINTLLKNFLQIDPGSELNLYSLIDAVLKDEILVLLGASKRILKIAAVFILLGLNWLFIVTIFVSCCHWRKLLSKKNRFVPSPPVILSTDLSSEPTDSRNSSEIDDQDVKRNYYSRNGSKINEKTERSDYYSRSNTEYAKGGERNDNYSPQSNDKWEESGGYSPRNNSEYSDRENSDNYYPRSARSNSEFDKNEERNGYYARNNSEIHEKKKQNNYEKGYVVYYSSSSNRSRKSRGRYK